MLEQQYMASVPAQPKLVPDLRPPSPDGSLSAVAVLYFNVGTTQKTSDKFQGFLDILPAECVAITFESPHPSSLLSGAVPHMHLLNEQQ